MQINHLAIGLCLILMGGCAQKIEPKASISEAQKRFEQKCHEDFDLLVTTKTVGQTIYIYLPTKDPIFDYEAQKENTEATDKKPSKFSLPYLDGGFKENHFAFEYDVIARKKTKTEDYGYSSSYTDSYVKAQNNLFTAINDTFFNAQAKESERDPLFFVIIITDIKKGIETRATFYLEDFKRYMSGDLPYEEYMKRFLADTKGGTGMIGDEVGTHIDYVEIKMPDFLAKQIINRINFKFTRSDFEPSDNYDNDIAGVAADTLRYYHFEDFKAVELHNLRLEKKLTYDKEGLKAFGDDAPDKNPAKGKLIHIRFENGKAQITE